jgi:DnaK suppressor protein
LRRFPAVRNSQKKQAKPQHYHRRRLMPLTKEQRTHLENRLRDERARALQALNRIVEDRSGANEQDAAGDLTLMPLHQADLGTDTMDGELDESNATRISTELTEIDAALERLYKTPAKFGICEDTAREIPFERLDIIPWARTCD